MNIGIEYFPFFLSFFFFYMSQQCVSLSRSEWRLNERVCTAASLSSQKREVEKKEESETREDDDCDNMWWKRGIGEKFATDQDPGLIRQLSRVIREMFPELHTPIGSSSLSSSGIQNSPWDINRSCTSVLVPKQLKRSILTVSRN